MKWISLWLMSWQVFISPHLLNAGSIWGITHNNNPTECVYQLRWLESQLASLEFPFIREIPWELWGLYNNSLILGYFPTWTSCSGYGLGKTFFKERSKCFRIAIQEHINSDLISNCHILGIVESDSWSYQAVFFTHFILFKMFYFI